MKADGILVCSQCYGTAHDLILENGKWSLLQCCYCNIGEWTDQRKPETKREGFRSEVRSARRQDIGGGIERAKRQAIP